MKTVIHLEDKGQDFLSLTVDEDGVVIEAAPFQNDIWSGSFIPMDDKELVKVGEFCPIHNKHIQYGYLKYRIEKIETIK